MTDFSNTAIAFRSKSDGALRRSYWLFRMMDFPWLVKLGTRLVSLLLWLRFPVEWLIKGTLFRQFCGGETIEECAATIEELGRFGVGTILDYSVEGNGSEAAFEHTTEEILKTVELAKGDPRIPFCVFKVTGIARFGLLAKVNERGPLTAAEIEEWERVRTRMEKICGRAHQNGVRIFVDAEESWVQDAIDGLAFEMMERFNPQRAIVYNTLQMYRTDRLEVLRRSLAAAEAKGFALGLKLVRGAYMEKERERAARLQLPSPILPDKAASDRSYDQALTLCLEKMDRLALCAGSHNENSCHLLMELMEKHGLAKNDERVYFSQLLGMGDHLSYNLANEGYNVAKYVPYGPVRSVMPYLFRRAEENTAIQGQSSRELTLLSEERQRRRGATHAKLSFA